MRRGLIGIIGLAIALGVTAGGEDSPARGRKPMLMGLPLQFDSELIRLHIGPDSLEVDGIYRFLCDPEALASQSLFYPYPQDSLLGGARMVSLDARPSGGEWRPAEFQETPQAHGARWRVPLLGVDSLEVRCIYRQALRTRYARYIVTTTRHWDRPLSHARFEIYLPIGMRPDRFSFPFTAGEVDGRSCWVYEETSFLPKEDIVVEWSPADE